ncbi:MAG: Ldh family oxidoreductase [Micromonosporaceae bacterium]
MSATATSQQRTLPVEEATALAVASLKRLGYTDDEAAIIADHLIEAGLRGYVFAGLPRILEVGDKMRNRPHRAPIEVVHETPVSAMVDGGGNVGYLTVHRGMRLAIEKAQQTGVGVVGVHNSYYSGRSGYYVEEIARHDLVGIHLCGAERTVVPHGGARPALGTNPVCFGFPTDGEPLVYDTGTSAIMHGEVQLRLRTGEPLPEGVAVDQEGKPTRDPAAALLGGFLPFSGHKGYGLSLCAQALGILAGSARGGEAADYGFFLLAMRPDLLMPAEEFKAAMAEFLAEVKATPPQDGVAEVLLPSERGRRQREITLGRGLPVDEVVYQALRAL